MRYLTVFLGIILLGGCITRTYTTETPRVDTEIKGNQGFLFGTPKAEPKTKKLGPNRINSVLEIELPSLPKLPRHKGVKEEETKPAEAPVAQEQVAQVEAPAVENQVPEKKYENYVIQKDDTLQKISEKFYGTTRKWQMLYEENKDVLKNPNSLRPGKTIKIPVLSK